MATTSKGPSGDRAPRHARNTKARARARPRPAGRTGAPAKRGATKAPTRPPSKRAPRATGLRGFLRRHWWKFLLPPVGLVVFAFLVLLIAYVRIDLPKAIPPVQTTFVYDRSGTRLLSTIHGAVDRTVIELRDIPEHTRDAVIAVEDARFYEHGGFDPRGTIRAAWTDLVEGGAVQGGSTITQQLVKRTYAGHYVDGENGIREYVTPPRTVKEKVREILLAMKVERTLTKDQILHRYLNTVYFGHGAYGIEAAAQTYFDVPASRLTVLQSATLAGILTAPEAYDPIDHPFDAKFRRDFALDRMVQFGHLEAEEAERLKRKPCCGIPLVAQEGREARIEAPGDAEYFVQYIKERLIGLFGSAEVFGGGLRVETSLDLGLQAAAEQTIEEALPTPGDPGAALVAIRPSTGEILTMVGGRDFTTSQLNLATFKGGTGRQAGSAFKAFTLAEAMRQHFDLDSVWYGPDTITIDDPRCADQNGELWTPENAEGGGGTYTLRSATANSVNTVFAQLVVELGPENVVRMAHDLGIRSDLPNVCAVTLGSVAVNPLEMTNAYATLAAEGTRHRASGILKVTRPGGERIGGPRSDRTPGAVNRNVALLVTDTLQGVLDYGTASSYDIEPFPAAGKTGTAQDNVDAWFCGYTVQLATCVWVGYPKGQIPLEDVEGVPLVYGGTIPAAIWHDFMTVALERLDAVPERFGIPDESGLTATPSVEAPIPAPTETPSPSEGPSPSEEPSEEPSPSPTEPPTETPSPPGGDGGDGAAAAIPDRGG